MNLKTNKITKNTVISGALTVFFCAYIGKLKKYKKNRDFCEKKVFKKGKLCYNARVYIYLGGVCPFLGRLCRKCVRFFRGGKS